MFFPSSFKNWRIWLICGVGILIATAALDFLGGPVAGQSVAEASIKGNHEISEQIGGMKSVRLSKWRRVSASSQTDAYVDFEFIVEGERGRRYVIVRVEGGAGKAGFPRIISIES